jgi:hypothetical protein
LTTEPSRDRRVRVAGRSVALQAAEERPKDRVGPEAAFEQQDFGTLVQGRVASADIGGSSYWGLDVRVSLILFRFTVMRSWVVGCRRQR